MLTSKNKASNSLQNNRVQLKKIDKQIVLLLAQRMHICEKIGNNKFQHKIGLYQTEYWKKILQEYIKTANKVGLNKGFVKKLFNTIRKESIRTQKEQFK